MYLNGHSVTEDLNGYPTKVQPLLETNPDGSIDIQIPNGFTITRLTESINILLDADTSILIQWTGEVKYTRNGITRTLNQREGKLNFNLPDGKRVSGASNHIIVQN